jgi:hypothetical protein
VSVKDSFQMIIYNVKIICLFEQDNSLCWLFYLVSSFF